MQEYFERPKPQPSNNRWFSHFVVATVGAVLGALLILALIPQLVPMMQDMGAMPVVEPTTRPGPAVTPPVPGGVRPPTPDTRPTAATDYEEAVKAVVRSVSPAIVSVTNSREVRDMWGRIYQQDGQGSGVVIDPAGYIVTNYHVIENATEIIVETDDGNEYVAEVVGEDAPTDLAVLKIDVEGLASVPFGDSRSIEPGQLAIAIGNPLGREFARSVTAGVVSGIRATVYGQSARQRIFQLIQTDASINPGNSGGALLNSSGELIGINTVKFAGAEVEGMGFAIPSNTVQRITSQLIEFGEVQRGWMGITVSPAVADDGGAVLETVLSGSPADRAGLRSGDRIVRVDGVAIAEVVDLLAYLEEQFPNQQIEIQAERNGEIRSFMVMLEMMPE